MDAAAYLKKQGWRGTGHSLDHTDRGIVRPLQISKKVDALGIGIQKYAAVSDQWWLRAYDQGLKDLGTGKESALATAKKHGVNRGGLYARFVRGAEIPGTIGQQVAVAVQGARDSGESKIQATSESVDKITRKRKRTQSMVMKDPQTTIKQKINSYIVEARRRGILPAESANKERAMSVPSEKDMKAVLRLAKMHKTAKRPVTNERQAIRSLKRAALQHLEQQMVAAAG